MNKIPDPKSIIEPLRRGVPPREGVRLYSTGYDSLIQGIKHHHLELLPNSGIIRFVSGSWGAGKTHFFRLLNEIAREEGLLVSNVELDQNSVALNKFHSVFAAIVSNISSPTSHQQALLHGFSPFAALIREALGFLTSGKHYCPDKVHESELVSAKEALLAAPDIDVDFKRMILHYWQSMLNDETGDLLLAQEGIVEWFAGSSPSPAYKKRYGISKGLTPQTARLMLQSLASFSKLAGYKGILILFDEAEQSYSVMRKAALREAQNNLLSLINNIQALSGLFLIYATTPDFFSDPRHGIEIYGALAQRIGMPRQSPPRALDLVWNLDAIAYKLEDFQQVALKLASIYRQAYHPEESGFPTKSDLCAEVETLYANHPNFAALRFWRLLISYLITRFDDLLEGRQRGTEERYKDVIESLRES